MDFEKINIEFSNMQKTIIKYNEMIVKGGLYEYFESNILPIINDFIILLLLFF